MWHNGRLVTALPLDDRGWSLGDALFETILVRHSVPVWLDEHLARLARGCERLGMDYSEKLSAEIAAALQAQPLTCGVLRICLSRCSDGQRGYRPATRRCHRYLQLSAYAVPPRQPWEQGIRSFVATTRLPEQPDLAGIKHTNRLPNILARGERDPVAFPEGLMLSESSAVIEGISSNLFVGAKGRLLTPRLDRAGVAGVARAKVVALAQQLGIPVSEVRLGLNDLYKADELFYCNSLIGLWPVRQLDCFHYASSRLCQQLQKGLESVWYG